MLTESEQSIRPGKMKETAKAHQREECAANCCHVCAGSDHRERRQSGSSLREFDVKFEMSRQDSSSQGPHNERARGVRHDDVASLVLACSGARVCHEKGREDSTGPADRSIKSAELVERCPLTMRRLVKRMQRRLQESRSRRRAT